MKLKEATMAGPIHTLKSGHLKKELVNKITTANKPVDMELINLEGAIVVRVTHQTTKEVIYVPYTNFSHWVEADK